jgi:hypothetical protein
MTKRLTKHLGNLAIGVKSGWKAKPSLAEKPIVECITFIDGKLGIDYDLIRFFEKNLSEVSCRIYTLNINNNYARTTILKQIRENIIEN